MQSNTFLRLETKEKRRQELRMRRSCLWCSCSNRYSNWQRGWLKPKSRFFPVATIATKSGGQTAIAFSMDMCTMENVQNPELLQVKQAGLNEVSFQFYFFTRTSIKIWRYFRKKPPILLVDITAAQLLLQTAGKAWSALTLSPCSSLISNNPYCLTLIVGIFFSYQTL